MGRNYLKGQAGQLLLDQMPFRGAVQVETVNSEGTADLCCGLGKHSDSAGDGCRYADR